MENNNVVVLKNFGVPSNPGAHYRLVCMTGAKKGEAYYLRGNRIVLGRGESCDIQVMDTKSSREHAELTRMGAGFTVTDLGSQNGVVVNDVKITQHALDHGDNIVIGQTVFKYGRVEVKENSPNVDPAFKEVKEDIEDSEEEQVSVGKNKIILIVGSLLAIYFFIGEESDPKKVKYKDASYKTSDVNDTFSRALDKQKMVLDKDKETKINAIFHRGLREVREKNYYRAINEFNLALILDPGNGRAQFYLDKTKHLLDQDISNKFITALKEVNALRYRSAIVSYCSIMRLLQSRPEDERYKTAEGNIREMEQRLGLEKDEIKCL